MQQLEIILLAVDFRPPSRSALQEAIYVAQLFRSEIIIFHAIEQLPHAAIAYQAIQQRAHIQLERLRAEICQQGVRVVHPPIVEVGNAVATMLSTADQVDANVIMLGSGEKRTMGRFLLGTTAVKAIHQSRRPVWVVKPSQARPHITSILCAVDFSEPAKRALRNAMLLRRAFGAELVVLHVIEAEVEAPPAETKTDALRLELEAFLGDNNCDNYPAQILIRSGKPADNILRTVREHRVELLVMGSVGRRGLSGLLIGNTAEQVVRAVPCSLLTVKGKDVLG
jgi:universal stress protein E